MPDVLLEVALECVRELRHVRFAILNQFLLLQAEFNVPSRLLCHSSDQNLPFEKIVQLCKDQYIQNETKIILYPYGS